MATAADFDCSICLEPFYHNPGGSEITEEEIRGQTVRIENCRHNFHQDCINACRRTSGCPLCRGHIGQIVPNPELVAQMLAWRAAGGEVVSPPAYDLDDSPPTNNGNEDQSNIGIDMRTIAEIVATIVVIVFCIFVIISAAEELFQPMIETYPQFIDPAPTFYFPEPTFY